MKAIGTGSTTLTDPKAAAAELVDGAGPGSGARRRWPSCSRRRSTTRSSLVAGVSELLGGIPAVGRLVVHRRLPGRRLGHQPGGAASLMLIADRSAGVGVRRGRRRSMRGRQAGGRGRPQAARRSGRAPCSPWRSWARGGDPPGGRDRGSRRPGRRRLGLGPLRGGKFEQFANGHAYKGHFAIAALGGPIGYAFTNGYRLDGHEGQRHARPRAERCSSSAAAGPWTSTRNGSASPRPRSAAAPSCRSASSTRCSSTRTGSRIPPTRSTATPTARWTSGPP